MTKILLIDDDEGFNEALSRSLTYEGYTVVRAFNGVEGCEVMRTERPDLIITDIVMPERDGLGVLKDLGLKMSNGDIVFPCKVIVITGGGRLLGPDYLERVEAMGVDAVLEKPFSLTDLVDVIERLVPQSA